MIYALKVPLRALRATPAATAAAILTIALGSGVNVAVFAVTYGLLLRPLPYPDPSRLVVMTLVAADGSEAGVSLEHYTDWQQRIRTVQASAAYTTTEFVVRGAVQPRVVQTALVTDRFFEVLGLAARSGQPIVRPDLGGLVVSDRLAAEFERMLDRAPLGAGLSLSGRARTIAGVMPPTFAFPSAEVDAWVSAASTDIVDVFAPGVDERQFRIVARLAPDVASAQARADAVRAFREVRTPEFDTPGNTRLSFRPLEVAVTGDVGSVLRVAMAAAMLVLLVACANVAALLLSRLATRRRALAVQRALGASTRRIVSGLMTESGLIALAGSLLGLGLGIAGVRLFVQAATGLLPQLHAVAIDLPVLGYATLMAIAVNVLCGTAPALHLVRIDGPSSVLGTSPRSAPAGWRLRATLVVGQIALSVVLLTGAALLMKTVSALLEDDIGVEPARALTAKLMLSDTLDFDAASSGPLVATLLERVRALPGVEAAGLGSHLPPAVAPIHIWIRFVTDTRDDLLMMSMAAVTPGYFEALGIPLLRGRLFEAGDGTRGEPVAVLSESAARFFSPGDDPVGRTLSTALPPITGERLRPRVNGIVPDVKYGGLDVPPEAAVYLPWTVLPAGISYLVVRTSPDPRTVVPALRQTVQATGPTWPQPQIQPLGDVIDRSIAIRRLRTIPAVSFAGLALAVALVGLVGTLAHAVSERRRELAIRAAMGASPTRLVGLILGHGAVLSSVGIGVGLVVAAWSGRGLAQFLYGVRPFDPPTFLGVAVLVGGTALLASYLPARRASAAQALELLRTE